MSWPFSQLISGAESIGHTVATGGAAIAQGIDSSGSKVFSGLVGDVKSTVSGMNSSLKKIEQGIGAYGNGVFSGLGKNAKSLGKVINSGAGEIVNGTVGSIESFSGIGSGLSLLKTKSQVSSANSTPKTVSTNSLPVGMGSGINSSFLDRYLFGLPIYVLIIIGVIIAFIVLWMVLK